MPIGFGFGVGDFIATINLFKDVAVALKDHGGARDDYDKTLSRLETTSAVLSCLEALHSPTGEAATVNAIRALASVIREDVDAFLISIEKYKIRLLQSRGPKKIISSAAAKIRWSQFVAKQVRKLYQDVLVNSRSLDQLLNLHIIHLSTSTVEEQGKARAHQADSHVANLHAHITTLKGVEDGLSNINAHLDLLDANSSRTCDQIILDITKQHEELKALVKNTAQQPDKSAKIMLVLTIPQLRLSIKDMSSILSHFLDEAEYVLKLFLASLILCFKDLLLAIPQMVLLYRVLKRLPQAISLVLHDNITFEDALGRVQSLQFQQFKHWKVFEACLKENFNTMPGMRKVVSKRYVLNIPNLATQLTSANWEMFIRPGSTVKMAIVLEHTQTEDQSCPRGCSATPTLLAGAEFCCQDCGLTYGLRENLRDDIFLPKTTSEAAAKAEGTRTVNRESSVQLTGRESWRLHGIRLARFQKQSSQRQIEREQELAEIRVFKRVQISSGGLKVPASAPVVAIQPTTSPKFPLASPAALKEPLDVDESEIYRCYHALCSGREVYASMDDVGHHRWQRHGIKGDFPHIFLHKCFGENCRFSWSTLLHEHSFRAHLRICHPEEDFDELMTKSEEWGYKRLYRQIFVSDFMRSSSKLAYKPGKSARFRAVRRSQRARMTAAD